MLISELMWTKRRRLLAAAVTCVVLIAGLVIFWQMSQVAEAAILEPHPGLVGWWRFDEGEGSLAKDSSGFGNDGVLKPDYPTNSPVWVDGKHGKALSFDGVDDYVDVSVGSFLQGFTAKTVLMWMKIPSYTGAYRIPYDHGSYTSLWGDRIELLPNANYFRFVLRNTGGTVLTTTSIAFTADTWTQLGYVWDGSDVKVVKNGVLSSPEPFSGTLNCSAYFYLGREKNNIYPSDGVIDEVRIYNRALFAAEIQEIFEKRPDFSSRLLAKVPKGTTQFIVTLTWQGGGTINITIERSPSQIYTEDMVPVYQKTVYSTSGGISNMLNIKRLAVSVTALSSDEDWYIILEFDDVEDYRITVEVQT